MAKKNAGAKKSNEEQIAAAKAVDFEEYVAEILALHNAADAEEENVKPAKGACLIKSSAMGGSVCIRTTPAACKAMKGVYIGGPCGG